MSEKVLENLSAIEEAMALKQLENIPEGDTPEYYQAVATKLCSDYKKQTKKGGYLSNPKDYEAGRAILESSPLQQLYILLYLFSSRDYCWSFEAMENALLVRNLPLTTEFTEKLLDFAQSSRTYRSNWNAIVRQIEKYHAKGGELTSSLRQNLREIYEGQKKSDNADARKLMMRIDAMLGESKPVMPEPGETWADRALADLQNLTPEQKTAWSALFMHAVQSDGGKPAAKWRKEGEKLLETVGTEQFDTLVPAWFSAVTSPAVLTEHRNMNGYEYTTHTSTGSDANISMLKGLAWLCADRSSSVHIKDILRSLTRLVSGCIKKIPGQGPWAVRAASAGVWALVEIGTMDAVGQLGVLKTRTSFRTVLNAIESGLETAAKKVGVAKADLEDMGVQSYGFEADGTRRENFGDCLVTAALTHTGEIVIEWFGANGKPVKSVPAEVKQNFATELKEFKADMDFAAKTLTAQKIRFDGFYLPERVWKLSDWRERFSEHPLVSNIAHRLIWHFSEGDRKAQGLYNVRQKVFEEVNGAPLTWLTDTTEMRLWHPIGFSTEEVIAWRNRLQELEITQPFKQAYREVYILTEAELRTNTYSNRFAGHLLKQHQMNALAALRGWKNSLRLMVDDEYPPASKTFPDYGLRAEYWVEGAGDDYGVHTTDSGTYLYLSTDQVRFYQVDAPENYAHATGGTYAPNQWNQNPDMGSPGLLPLTEVPAVLFSEVMRDVDMFVGVCSVGNDPSWRDGGQLGSFADYWSDYSFGDLSATAQTRRSVLEKLLPRLKIASQCTLSDKFLVVRGDIRTYKIHLGSGNILMEPNDQYLCIVESRGASKSETPQFLPYEGDQRLALILSKAFLLSEDTKITDVTITRQLKS